MQYGARACVLHLGPASGAAAQGWPGVSL